MVIILGPLYYLKFRKLCNIQSANMRKIIKLQIKGMGKRDKKGRERERRKEGEYDFLKSNI